MATTTHVFPVSVSWIGGRDGSGNVSFTRWGENAALAVPPEFGGPGGSINPEEMLTGAVASCYSITFGIIAANRKLPVLSVTVDATGEVEQIGAAMTINKIVLRPLITVSGTASDEQIKATEEMAIKADRYCLVTNAVRDKVEVVIEPVITKPL